MRPIDLAVTVDGTITEAHSRILDTVAQVETAWKLHRCYWGDINAPFMSLPRGRRRQSGPP
jgi:hypothetical protein